MSVLQTKPAMLLIISGGQTGVDIAALMAARKTGLKTGGTMPLGFMTTDGRHEDWASQYGLSEYGSYAARTELNVKNADATLRIARIFSSPGERCTLRYVRKHAKPHLDINVDRIDGIVETSIVNWLVDTDIKTLNVAGNSEQTAPGIFVLAYHLLIGVFTRYQQVRNENCI